VWSCEKCRFANSGYIARCAACGEPAAFEDAWRLIAIQVARSCRWHTRDEHDADDLYQRVMIRAWRGHATFRGESSYLAWVRAIVVREAGRLAAQREWRARHEVPLPAVDAAGLSEPAPGPDEQADWIAHGAVVRGLRTAFAEAAAHGSLSGAELRVVEARLGHPDETWEQLAVRLGVSANVCAVTHCRAVPKLRVFLFLHRPDLLGGAAAIAAAFTSATGALAGEEAAVFRALVLDARRDYRRRGWQRTLRSACAKVAGHLSASVGATA